MNGLPITPEIVLRVTRDLQLYTEVPFLNPIKTPALAIAAKFANLHCKSCARTAMLKAAKPLADAFTRLLRDEAAKTPNTLGTLRTSMARILNTPLDEVRVTYRDEKGVTQEIKF